MSFSSFGLTAELTHVLSTLELSKPTPIQQQGIPVVLEGRDLIASAQTGTGKTLAFALPLVQRLTESEPANGKRCPRALILTPTRELAQQVCAVLEPLASACGFRAANIFGGVNIKPQIAKLRRGVDIVVATPGRLLDIAGQQEIDLSSLEILVLDEADRMLDMGFIRDIRKILALLPNKRQNLMFSATYNNEIKALAANMMRQPQTIEVSPRNSTVATIEHSVYRVAKSSKRHLLQHLLETEQWFQVLVFARTKHGANRLAQQLDRAGIESAAIHGNKSQNARTQALARFKQGQLRVLVATDIAARGLDIERLPYVVNFDLPNVAEDYVHRIGRTGRNGESGIAISFVDRDEVNLLKAIERLLKRRIEQLELPPAIAEKAAADNATQKADAATNPAGRNANQHREAPKAPKAPRQRSRGGRSAEGGANSGNKPKQSRRRPARGAARKQGSR